LFIDTVWFHYHRGFASDYYRERFNGSDRACNYPVNGNPIAGASGGTGNPSG
jgi:hypothetical protein